MNSCAEIRWSLNDFLAGRLSAPRDEKVRLHLELCSDCAEQLAQGNRLDRFLEISQRPLSADFTRSLLKHFPESGLSAMVSRYLAVVFGASAAFAAAAYWLFQQFMSVGGDVVTEQLGTNRESLNLLVGRWLANPTIQYMGLAILALILCGVLILLVDTPRLNEREARN